MKTKLIGPFLLFFILGFAQQVQLDLKSLEKNLKDPKSNYHYDKVLFKYLGYPQSMDSTDIQYLYYGRNFAGTKVSMTDEDFKKLAEYYRDEKFTEAAQLGEQLFKKDPSNLDVLLILLQSLKNIGNEKDFIFRLHQFRTLITAIKNSGDGKTEKTPIIVNSVGDEYIFLNTQNIQLDGFNRTSKVLQDGMMDVWNKGNESIYVKILYLTY